LPKLSYLLNIQSFSQTQKTHHTKFVFAFPLAFLLVFCFLWRSSSRPNQQAPIGNPESQAHWQRAGWSFNPATPSGFEPRPFFWGGVLKILEWVIPKSHPLGSKHFPVFMLQFLFLFLFYFWRSTFSPAHYIYKNLNFFEGLDVLPPSLKKSQNQILDNLKGFHEPTQKDFEVIVGEGLGEW